MKVVKFNKTHRLFQYGYTHGIRFNIRTREAAVLMSQLVERFGRASDKWTHYRSRKGRPFWIGFKDEKVLTFMLIVH